MLKIKKTKPYQHYSSVHIIICTIALICSIVPTLALLTYYNADKTYAVGADITSISTMQEMKPYICDNTEVGTSHTLTDIRDNSTYTVAKLSDGKCWMTQNLRIVDKEITPEDSDIAENFTIPASAGWTDKTYTAPHAYYQDDVDYGAYYNWYTATAGTGTGALAKGDAKSSICPKGWRLPKGESSGEYQALYNKGKSSWTTNSGKNGYWLGGTGAAAGGAFFPAAGAMNTNGGSLSSVSTHGIYWSSTAESSYYSYRLRFDNAQVNPADYVVKYEGQSVRCIAESWPSKDVDVIAVVVPPVISIDATSGMKEEVDPNKITTGTISATVSANTTYTVQLSANKTSLTNSQNPEETEITNTNSISASSNVQAKTNAWGILNQDNSTYSAITSTPTVYYNTESTNEDSSRTHTFILGVSVSPTLPAGEYSTTVTITAVNN